MKRGIYPFLEGYAQAWMIAQVLDVLTGKVHGRPRDVLAWIDRCFYLFVDGPALIEAVFGD